MKDLFAAWPLDYLVKKNPMDDSGKKTYLSLKVGFVEMPHGFMKIGFE